MWGERMGFFDFFRQPDIDQGVQTFHQTPGAVLLDVRTPGEVRKQGLLRSDALHIPLDELRGRLGELDKGKKIYVNCYSGLRSYLACRILSQDGFQCSNLSGGWRFWSYNATDRAHDAAPTHLCGVPTGKD